MEKILTDKNFDEELKNIGEGSPMLVDFWAPWCAPCRMQLPIVEKMAEEGYHVGKVNIDEQMGLAGRFGVMSIPTLIVFKDGKEQQRFVGVQSRQVLEDAIDHAWDLVIEQEQSQPSQQSLFGFGGWDQLK